MHSGGAVEALPLVGREANLVLVHDAWLPFPYNISQASLKSKSGVYAWMHSAVCGDAHNQVLPENPGDGMTTSWSDVPPWGKLSGFSDTAFR
jgi:hypothetical protein